MKLYPETTRFFINGWTWGYEAVYEAIARSFQSQVGKHCLVSKPWLTYITYRFMSTGTSTAYILVSKEPLSYEPSSRATKSLPGSTLVNGSTDVTMSTLKGATRTLTMALM